MQAFQMLPGIQLRGGQPGPGVPPINNPGPAPPNVQGSVVANCMRQLDLYNERNQIKELANQVIDYAFPHQKLLLHLEDATGTLNGEICDYFTYLWSTILQEDQDGTIIEGHQRRLRHQQSTNMVFLQSTRHPTFSWKTRQTNVG